MPKQLWIHLSILALVIACGSKQSSSKPPAETETAQPARMCSMMKDAQIAATDDEHGVAITFTTTGDPAELRAHVHKMATMHDRMSHEMMGSGATGGMHEHMAMAPSHAAVDDVDHGARIVLTPDDPTQLAMLRDQVHAHVEMMKSGKCPMMDEQPAEAGPHKM